MQPAFQHLNLFKNPFGAISPEDLANLAIVQVEQFVKPLQNPGTAIQFLADHGRGKTTNLLALHALLPEHPYTQLHRGDKQHFENCALRFIDSVENLSRASRKQLYQASESIALTTHKSLTAELKRNGFHVMTMKISTTDPRLLQDIFNRRIENVRRSADVIPVLSLQDIKVLRKQYKDDIRSMEHYLYDVFQKLAAPQDLALV